MRGSNISTLWKPTLITGGNWKGKFGIASISEIKVILQYERIRADRDSHAFSIVLVKPNLKHDAALFDLIQILKRSIRTIDHLGWYDEKTMCIILTATNGQGAVAFTKKIIAYLAINTGNVKKLLPSYRVLSYPNIAPVSAENNDVATLKIYQENRLLIEDHLKQGFELKNPLWKRAIDVIGALCGLVVLMPLFLMVALYIKTVSKGPILFKQDRVGFQGKTFSFIKFRTMHTDSKETTHVQHSASFIIRSDIPMKKLDDHDPRIIPGGKLLRNTCIDELPQLWNVLRSDMSLVGPRPCIPYEAEEYVRWQAQRFDILPGMTGLWQVSGKNELTFHEMISLDIVYARERSLLLDILILLRTIPTILHLIVESVKKHMYSQSHKQRSIE